MASGTKTSARKATYPIAHVSAVLASASLLVLVPVWQPDALLHVLDPLGYFDASIAAWLTVFAVPLILLIIISDIPVLLARHRHVGYFAGIDEALGPRMSTLAAASQFIEYISTYALAAASIGFLIGSMWPSMASARTPVAISAALLIAMLQMLKLSKQNLKLAAVLVFMSFALLIFLTAGILGSSPYFAGTSSSDLALVSREVSRGSPFARGIAPALGLGLGVVLAPALLMGHLTNDLSHYSIPHVRNAGAAIVAIALAASFASALAMMNIADVDSARFIGRSNTFYAALRAVGLPEWVLISATAVLILVAITSARTVLSSVEKLSGELANFHLLPIHLMNEATRQAFAPFVTALGASAVLFIGNARFQFIVPTLALSGFTSLTLTRWSTVRYWNKKLAYEGHTPERNKMKRARLMALGGLVISAALVVLLFISDIFKGAWITAGMVLSAYVLLYTVRRHYLSYGIGAGETTTEDPIIPGRVHYMIVAQNMGPVLARATRWINSTRPYSLELLHVDTGGGDGQEALKEWREKDIGVDLTILDAGQTRVTEAIVEHVRRTRAAHPNRLVNVVLPQVVFKNPVLDRFHNMELHHLEKTLLDEPGVMTTVVPWAD